MDKMQISIGWMYPNCLNLHGERGSVQALKRVGENLGLEVQIRRIDDFNDTVPFDQLDLLFFGPGELKVLGYICPALQKQRKALEAYVNRGGYILAIGTTGLLFGKETLREDGSTFNGLGLLDMTGKERKFVFGDDLHFRLSGSKQEIFGSEIQMADVHAANPLGELLYGRGNNADGTEGARYKNLIYTNCLGPVFAKNPWWAEDIIKDICLKKLGISQKAPYTLESAAFASGLRYTKEKPPFEIK